MMYLLSNVLPWWAQHEHDVFCAPPTRFLHIVSSLKEAVVWADVYLSTQKRAKHRGEKTAD
jgi:hypothetical protein